MLFGEETEELSSGTVLQGEEEFLVVLEGVIELDDEGMVHADQNIAFSHDMIFLLAFLDVLFLEYLHGIDSLAFLSFLLDEDHLCIGAFADD